MDLKELLQIRSALRGRVGDEGLRDSAELDSELLNALEELHYGNRTADLGGRAIERAQQRREERRREYVDSLQTEDRPEGAKESTTTDLLTSEALASAIAPQVEELREAGPFESSEPPFNNVADAASWLERESAADRESFLSDAAKQAALDEIRRLKKEHGLTEVQIDSKRTLLPYQRPGDDHAKHVPTFPRTYLERFALRTESISRHTGLPHDALTMHVLTGFTPLRSRARIATTRSHYSVPGGQQIDVSHAEVKFFARDLTYKELRNIYNSIRGHVTGKGRKGRADDPQAQIWALVQKRGGPPLKHGTKQRFWTEILEAWTSEQPPPRNGEKLRYTTPRGAEKAYDAARKRLE